MSFSTIGWSVRVNAAGELVMTVSEREDGDHWGNSPRVQTRDATVADLIALGRMRLLGQPDAFADLERRVLNLEATPAVVREWDRP